MSRKPAASSGDGAAGRSLFRSCKQPTKASCRQESDQLTRQNQLQPASGAELDADRLDGPAPNLGSDLALAPVTDPRELYGVGNLVPLLSEPHGVGNPVPPLSELQVVNLGAPPLSVCNSNGDLAPHPSLTGEVSHGVGDRAPPPPLSDGLGDPAPRQSSPSNNVQHGERNRASSASLKHDCGGSAPHHRDQSRPGSVTSNVEGDFAQSDQDLLYDEQVVLTQNCYRQRQRQDVGSSSYTRCLAVRSPIIEVLANTAEKARAALDLALLSNKATYGHNGDLVSFVFESEAEARRVRALDAQHKSAVRQLEDATLAEQARQRKKVSQQPLQEVPVVAHLHGPQSSNGGVTAAPSQLQQPHFRRPLAAGGGNTVVVPTARTQYTLPASTVAVQPSPARSPQAPTQGWSRAAGDTGAPPRQSQGHVSARLPTANSERRMVSRFDPDERRAIRTAHDIGAESRSEDSQARSVDENGFWHGDGFVVHDNGDDDDDDDGDSLSSGDETSTDDDSCTEEEGDEEDPRETGLERKKRMELIQLELSKMEKKAKARGQDTFYYSAEESLLPELCVPNVRIGRRTHRTTLVKLIINSWLTGDVRKPDLQQVSEFLRLVSLHSPERAISIFYVLIKRILPVSFTLFKFLYRCVTRYIPTLKRTFKQARWRLQAKRDKQLAKSKTQQADAQDTRVIAQAPFQHQSQVSKPVLKPPTLKDVTDIATVVGRFHNEYRAYFREQRACKLTARTMFQCLDADQAATLASMSQRDEDELDVMECDALLEIWRSTFGLQSSAAVLRACNRIPFNGNSLDLVVWADWSRRFRLMVAQAPVQNLPPPKELAKVFVQRCQDSFLSHDVLANEPATLDAALRLVMQRLNDSGFLMSHHLNQKSQQQDRNPDVPIKFVRRDGHGGGGGGQGGGGQGGGGHGGAGGQANRSFPRPDGPSREQRERFDPPRDRQEPRDRVAAPTQPRGPAQPLCRRCRKPGHKENACISKHDADGNTLERQDPEVYAKRKEQARLEAAQRAQQKVQAVQAEDSDTEDVESELRDEGLHFTDDEQTSEGSGAFQSGGAFSISNIVNLAVVDVSVPAPRLVGIETNPGPYRPPQPYLLYALKRRHQCRFESLAHAAHCNNTFQFQDTSQPQSSLVLLFTMMSLYFGYTAVAMPPAKWRWHIVALEVIVWLWQIEPTCECGDDVHHPLLYYEVFLLVYVYWIWKNVDNDVPPPSLLECGDVEANPGPPPPVITLQPSVHRRPRQYVPQSFFESSSLPAAITPTPPALPTVVSTDMPALLSDSCSSDSEEHYQPSSTVMQEAQAVFGYESSNPDTSDVDSPLPAVSTVVAATSSPHLEPPRFNAFLVAPGSKTPPPLSTFQVCAVDTMCQGDFCVISKSLVDKLKLPCAPCQYSARTASNAVVNCSSMASFCVVIFVLGAWISLPTRALVWDKTAEPILLSNSFALSTGLIDFVKPNAERVKVFGEAVFATDWHPHVTQHEASVLAAYHEDVMPEELDDVIDLSAPLRCGDQDVSALPPDAMAYAKRYPEMTRAIPRDAHPGLVRWTAQVQEDKIPNYAWPKTDLKDLKEEPLPFAFTPKLHKEFDKLIAMHYAEEVTECPTAVAMRAQLIQKSKTETRFCVNGSTQKNILSVLSWPMPHIRQIFAFVAGFPWRAKIDLKHGYHNFEIDPASRKWTVTIGAGRAIQWRKLVQGFAPSGAFFQFAMCKLLGPDIVWKIAAVYLDDIIVVGKSTAECAANVATVMARLASFKFRINFAKCAFTPSPNIDFLGCRLEGTLVLPGPKVSAMLSRIRPPHEQHTPKAQRHHLHVFLGMCAFIMQHAPGLKQTLAPLYLSVASEPFRYGDAEKDAFSKAMVLLQNLNPYFLPSSEPDVIVEVMSDASGGRGDPEDPGAWSAVLGQRKSALNLEAIHEGFELLQCDGGVFNRRQATWDVLNKEAFALFQGLLRFRPFVYGRRVRVIVDSKVLMFMFRSESPVIKRWHAFIQTLDYEMVHVPSESNAIADCISRTTYIAPPAAPTVPSLLRRIPTSSSPAGHHSSPRPHARVNAVVWAPVDAVPAQPLTRYGIESNPGPSDSPSVIQLSSDSDDDAPLVQPSPPAAEASPPVVQPSRRRNVRPSPPEQPATSADGFAPVRFSSSDEDAPVIAPLQHRQRQQVREAEAPPAAEQAPANVAAPQLGIDDNWPSHTLRLRCRRTNPGTDVLCTAVSDALRNEQTASRRGPIRQSPPSRPVEVREHTLWFLSEYPNTVCDERTNLSARALFLEYRRRSMLQVQFDHRDDAYAPATWSEYQTLMADDGTYPDIIFLHAIARLYRVQIVVTDRDSEAAVSEFVIAPPDAYRRIFLFSANNMTTVNWAHEAAAADADVAEGGQTINFTFKAPALVAAPDSLAPHDDALHSLYNRMELSNKRLQEIFNVHNGYTGHSGVERTVRMLRARGTTWKGITADVAQFIKRCPTCCASRLKLQYAPVSPSSLRLHARPLSRWHLDSSGTMPTCAFTGYTQLIVFVCETTQFTVLFGSRFGTALEIAIALVRLMGWFDMPESVHSDHGSENENYIWFQMQQITGMKHTFSMPYIPETNGIAEGNIGAAKQFIRLLSTDIGRHNAWGLLLPLAQKGLNALPRKELQWFSPSQLVFASCISLEAFAIPTFYERHLRDMDWSDVHGYGISANFGHRAMLFQQSIVNAFHDLKERALDEACARDPSAVRDLSVGKAVLIDWPNQPPSPSHPKKRGPYRVIAVRRNVVQLQHLVVPPPDQQPAIVEWSAQAHVYVYPNDHVPQRHSEDPSAALTAADFSGRQIECVLSHRSRSMLHRGSHLKDHVSSFEYLCRLATFDVHDAAFDAAIHYFGYDEVKHSFAFDCYALAHRSLRGHVPICHMPVSWNPLAVTPVLRPSHEPHPIHEYRWAEQDDISPVTSDVTPAASEIDQSSDSEQ